MAVVRVCRAREQPLGEQSCGRAEPEARLGLQRRIVVVAEGPFRWAAGADVRVSHAHFFRKLPFGGKAFCDETIDSDLEVALQNGFLFFSGARVCTSGFHVPHQSASSHGVDAVDSPGQEESAVAELEPQGNGLAEASLGCHEGHARRRVPLILDFVAEVAPEAVALLLADGLADERVLLDEFGERLVHDFVRALLPQGQRVLAREELSAMAVVKLGHDEMEETAVVRLSDLSLGGRHGGLGKAEQFFEEELVRATQELRERGGGGGGVRGESWDRNASALWTEHPVHRPEAVGGRERLDAIESEGADSLPALRNAES